MTDVRRVALISAAVCVIAWALKAAVIAWAGPEESSVEGVLFVVGLLALAATGGALAFGVVEDRDVFARAVGVAVGVIAALFALILVGAVVEALDPADDPHWVWEELNLWVVSLAVWFAVRAWAGRRA